MALDFYPFVRFWLLLFLTGPSVLCSFVQLYHLIFDRQLRQSLSNQLNILLLVIILLSELIDIPLISYYYRVGHAWIVPIEFDRFWSFTSYTVYSLFNLLFAWASIERYILIFHDRWTATRTKRLVIHHIPICLLLVYCFSFYTLTVLVYACPTTEFRSTLGTAYPCSYNNNPTLNLWDLSCNQILPTCVIGTFSVGLLVHVLYRKARVQQRIHWRKQRKMTVQLLSTTFLFLLFNLPWVFLQICAVFELPIDSDRRGLKLVIVLEYYAFVLFPFLICGSLPQLKRRLKKLLFWRWKQNAVGPAVVPARAKMPV